MHILAVGAHAADIEFSAGAVLLKHVRMGHTAGIVHLTLGERGNNRLTPTEYAAQKRQEALQAAQGLSVEAEFLDEPDAFLCTSDHVANRLATVIRRTQPTVVITHWGCSFHHDHRNCNELVKRAIFLAELPSVELEFRAWKVERLYYTDNWEDQERYVPDVAIDVTEVFDDWLAATDSYSLFRDGGLLGFDYRSYYRSLAEMRGALARVPKAVALLQARDWERLRKIEVL